MSSKKFERVVSCNANIKLCKAATWKKGVVISFVANEIKSLLIEFISLCFQPLKLKQSDDLIYSWPTVSFIVSL